MFELAQEKLQYNKQRRTPKGRVETPYLLSGRLFCGICGSPMPGVSGYGKRGVKYGYYTCGKRWREKACPKKNVSKDIIESAVLNAVRNALSDPETLDALADRIYDSYLAESEDTSQVDALKNRIHDVDKSINQLLRAIELGAVSAALTKRLNDLETEKADLEKALAEAGLSAPTLTRDMIRFFLERITQFGSDDTATNQRLIDTFVKAVYAYDDGRILIDVNYTDRDNGRISLDGLNELCSNDVQSTPLSQTCSNTVWYNGHLMLIKKLPD